MPVLVQEEKCLGYAARDIDGLGREVEAWNLERPRRWGALFRFGSVGESVSAWSRPIVAERGF